MKKICFDRDRIGEYVSKKIDHFEWGKFTAIGLEENNELIAGCIFNHYVKNIRCSIHCAAEGKNWLNREFLWIVFDYAFNQLNCKILINYVCSTNSDSLKFTEHIGFSQEHIIPEATEDGDLVIFTMKKLDCKWLENEKYRKKYYAL